MPWVLVLTLPACSAEGIECAATWADDARGARVLVEGKAEVPDGGVLDVALEFEGAAVARAEAEVRDGAWRTEIALGDWGYAGHYVVAVRYDPIAQDHTPQPAERALSTRYPLERGAPQDAISARWDAARALDGVSAIVRETIGRARRVAADPNGVEAVARETAGLEAGLRAAQAEAWPYLPLSRGAVDRLRGWARGRPTDGRAEALSAWFAIGERLAAAVDRAVLHEREGRRPEPENGPRPVSTQAPDPEIAVAAVKGDGTDEAIDALGLTFSRMGSTAVDRLRRFLVFDPDLARRAIRCMGWMTGGAALEVLRPLAARGRPELRAEALRSLARLGDRDSAALVRSALTDPEPVVRAGAVEAIVLLGGEEGAPLLFPLADDPDREVGRAAREGVRRLAGDWPADLDREASEGAPEALKRWWLERSGQP